MDTVDSELSMRSNTNAKGYVPRFLLSLKEKERKIQSMAKLLIAVFKGFTDLTPSFQERWAVVYGLHTTILIFKNVEKITNDVVKDTMEHKGSWDKIVECKTSSATATRNLCVKVYKTAGDCISKVIGRDEELYYLILRRMCKEYLVHLESSSGPRKEEAKQTARELKELIQYKIKNITVEGTPVILLASLTEAFIQHELRNNFASALSTARQGSNIPLPGHASEECRKNYGRMRDLIQDSMRKWRKTSCGTIIQSELEKWQANGDDGIEAEGKSWIFCFPRGFFGYAALQWLFIVGFSLFFRSAFYLSVLKNRGKGDVSSLGKSFTDHFLDQLHLFIVTVQLESLVTMSLVLFFHIFLIGFMTLSRKCCFVIWPLIKGLNIFLSSVVIGISVWVGCEFQKQTLKDLYLMWSSLCGLLYFAIISFMV